MIFHQCATRNKKQNTPVCRAFNNMWLLGVGWALACCKLWWTSYLTALACVSVCACVCVVFVQPCRVSLPITTLHRATSLMAAHHDKSFSARHLFTCVFTIQVSSFEGAQQFAKQIHSPVYVSKKGLRVWERLGSIGAETLSREGLGADGEPVGEQWGAALWEANIFSGSGQQSENTPLMLMCIRSERANISSALQWQSGLRWMLLRM